MKRPATPILAAAAVVAVVAVFATWSLVTLASWPGPAATAAMPTLPERFADLSMFTADTVDRPAGRAVAVYEATRFELLRDVDQTLLAGADRDTYRRIDSPADALLPADNLSPWHTVLLSPDGRYVAYALPNATPPAHIDNFNMDDAARPDRLVLLDPATNHGVDLGIGQVAGVAFSPDSSRLAVVAGDMGEQSAIFSVNGSRLRDWAVPADVAPLDGGIQWSPDGSLVAIGTHTVELAGECADVRFVDMTSDARAPAGPVCGQVLGWRDPADVVVLAPGTAGDRAIMAKSIVDSDQTLLATFPTTCEYCWLRRVQLATNLLPTAGTRPPDPDRGPWVPIAHSGLITAAALLGALVVWLLILLIRRRGHKVQARAPEPALDELARSGHA